MINLEIEKDKFPTEVDDEDDDDEWRVSNLEIIKKVLPLGFCAYGGPMAHISILR